LMSPTGEIAISVGPYEGILWPVQMPTNASMELPWTVELGTEVRPVRSAAFSTDGKLLAIVGGGLITLDITDPRHPKKLATIGRNSGIYAVTIRPDGRQIAAACEDGIIRVFEPDTLHLLFELKTGIRPLRHVAFSSDGSLLLASGTTDSNVT